MLATAQNPEPMAALNRIQAAGFTLKLRNTRLVVSPADRLTADQRAFIASHKAALVEALSARATTEREPLTAVEAVDALQQAGFTVAVKRDTLIVEPADELSEAQRGLIGKLSWAMVQLLAVAREREPVAAPGYVCCATCPHSVLSANTEPRNGWRSCGLDLPGGFGQALRHCEQWEAAP